MKHKYESKNYITVSTRQMYSVCNCQRTNKTIKKFIELNYKRVFDAKSLSFLDNLVAAKNTNGAYDFAFGFNDASQGKLFLETYLDLPIQHLLSEITGKTVHRHEIVEVGNLALRSCESAGKDILDIALFLQGQGYRYIVCTATRMLRFLFLKASLKPIVLAQADFNKLNNNHTQWGSYYQSSPKIIAGNLQKSIDQLHKNKSQMKINKTLSSAGEIQLCG